MQVATVKLPERTLDRIDRIAEEYDSTRAAVLRSVIDNGLRAPKYYSAEFPIEPDRYEQDDAVKLAKKGELPR